MKISFALQFTTVTGAFVLFAAADRAGAGTFFTDFNSGKPAASSLYGSASVETSGGASGSGVLRLTDNANNRQGSFVINDLDAGKAIAGFSASFKLRIGGGTGADGFSFNFAPDLPNDSFGETGAGTGLTISFDTFDNGGGRAPGIDVKYGGVLAATKKFNPRTGAEFVDVTINVGPNGALTLAFGNSVVYSNLFAYVPLSGRFGLGARTGSNNDNHMIDDLRISTIPLAGAYVKSVTPRGSSVRPDAPITIELQDFKTQVDVASIKLALNGASVVPTVSKEGELTTIQLARSGLLASGSTNSLSLNFNDSSVPPVSSAARFDFIVDSYLAIPSSFALASSVVDTNKTGFKVRTVQALTELILPPTLARAEAQLAGTLIDPVTQLTFTNAALLGPNPDKSFDESGVVNYEKDQIPVGNFIDTEGAIPGIRPNEGNTDNFAVEILTYLFLPAGYHKFGVNSDDGFKVTIGNKDARDAFSTIAGQFDGVRETGETIFSVANETAGLFNFRLVWFQSGGGANLEFYSIANDGTKILVNDRTNPDAIKASRELRTGVPVAPFVQFVSPKPDEVRVSRNPKINIAIRDQTLLVVENSVQLTFNGVLAKSMFSKTGGLTSVSFEAPTALASSSMNTLSLTYRDTANPPNTVTREWRFTTTPVVPATGQWDFENGTLAATVGQPLEYGDISAKEVSSLTQFGATSSFRIPDIGGQPAKVMKFNRNPNAGVLQPGFVMKHGIAANGGGAKVNQWTMIMDVLFPEPQDNRYCSLIQIDDLTSDGDMFVRWNNIGGEGTGGLGVEGQFTGDGRTYLVKGKWHRIAIAADLAADAPVISKYIDGVKFEDQFLVAPQLDGRFALGKTLRLFSDNDNQVNTVFVNSIQVLDGKMIDAEIAALGGPSASGIPLGSTPPPPANSPAITVNRSGSNLSLSWGKEFGGFVLESTDSLANPAWTAVTGVANNSAAIQTAGKSKFFRLRK